MLDLSHSGFRLLHDTLLIILFLVYDLVHLPNPTSSFLCCCRGLLIFLTKQFKLLICNYFYCFNYWFILTKKRKEKKGYSKHNNYNNNYYYYLQLLQEWCILDIYVYNCFRIESWMDSGLIICFNPIINHFIFCYLLFIATKSNCLGQPINLIHPLF